MDEFKKKELPETFSHKRGPLLERLGNIAHYQHTRALHEQMLKELANLKEQVSVGKTFKNPREEADYLHKQKTFQVLSKQEKHMKRKLVELEKRIREDMATFDKEVTNP